MLTVVTSTIGRLSLLKLCKSLSKQNIKVFHFLLWDKKRTENGINPHDLKLKYYENNNYKIFHYEINHPIILNSEEERIDNHMRVIGLSMATTPYITLIDDDCWVENNWFTNAINSCNKFEYCFSKRYLWHNNKKLGIDNYESIGYINKFGYKLIDINSIVFKIQLKNKIISSILNNNRYFVDRDLAEVLLSEHNGCYIDVPYLNQIIPDFLLDFHLNNLQL